MARQITSTDTGRGQAAAMAWYFAPAVLVCVGAVMGALLDTRPVLACALAGGMVLLWVLAIVCLRRREAGLKIVVDLDAQTVSFFSFRIRRSLWAHPRVPWLECPFRDIHRTIYMVGSHELWVFTTYGRIIVLPGMSHYDALRAVLETAACRQNPDGWAIRDRTVLVIVLGFVGTAAVLICAHLLGWI